MKEGEYQMKRSGYPDLVKGIAIALTVIGHNIQFGTGGGYYNQELYFYHPLFKAIYSFHMPLFMLLSGYLFAFSIEKYEPAEIMKNKINSLLVPIVTWSCMKVMFNCITDSNRKAGFVIKLIKVFVHNLWFLWAIILCSSIVLFVHTFLKDSIAVYLGLLCLMLMIPDWAGSHLYKYMYPYFVTAYFWNRNGIWEKLRIRYMKMSGWLIALVCVVYLLLLSGFSYESYVYTSRVYLFRNDWVKQIGIDVYRWIIGYCGAAIVLMLLYRIRNSGSFIVRVFQSLGRYSLGIYIISDFIYKNMMLKITAGLTYKWHYIAVESIVMLLICFAGCKVMTRFGLLRYLCLGGRK